MTSRRSFKDFMSCNFSGFRKDEIFFHPLAFTQNHRIVEVGSGFWRLSCPTLYLISSRAIYSNLPRTISRWLFDIHPRMETPHPSELPAPILGQPHREKILSRCSEGTSCLSVCAHCLLAGLPWAPLKIACLSHLPSGIYIHFRYLYTLVKSSLSLLFC